MSHDAFLAQKLFNKELMIDPAKLEVIVKALGPKYGVQFARIGDVEIDLSDAEKDKINAQSGSFETVSEPLEEQTTIAVLRIGGTLVNRRHGLDAISGLTSYETITADLKSALANDDISGIILDLDSPGGEVDGVFDLADLIYESRAEKPIWAFANGMALSAAYMIGSAAEKLFVTQTADTGSVGVIAMHMDQSKFNENIGVKFTAIFAGAHKNDLSPHEELGKETHARLQTRIDQVYTMFTDRVAQNRGMSTSAVRGTEADFYMGKAGVDIGFSDGVKTRSQLIEDFTKRIENKTSGINAAQPSAAADSELKTMTEETMTGKEKPKDKATTDTPEETAEQTSKVVNLDAARDEGAVAERERTTEIMGLCTLAGYPNKAQDFIASGASVKQVQAKLTELKAQDDTEEINGTQSDSMQQGTNEKPVGSGIIGACEKLAEQTLKNTGR